MNWRWVCNTHGCGDYWNCDNLHELVQTYAAHFADAHASRSDDPAEVVVYESSDWTETKR